MNIINRLGKTKYQQGAELALQNAKNHLEVSTAAEKIKQFGIATSLLVLASEELAKASILKIKSINPLIRIDNLHKYFRNHRTKHESIFKIFPVSMEYLNDKTSDRESKNNETKLDNTTILLLLIAIGVYLYFMYQEKDNTPNLNPQKNKNKKQERSYLDEVKEAGFYLGFDEDNKSWKVPNQVNSFSDYESFKETANIVFETIEQSLFNNEINDKNITEFIDKLEDKNIDIKHLKKIQEKLKQQK